MKICSLYGAGFYYIPGTDTCLKVGGWTRFEYGGNYNGSLGNGVWNNNLNNRSTHEQTWRAKGVVSFDAREQTAYGTLRSYVTLGMSNSQNGDASTSVYFNRWFIQWAGFTVGRAQSFFDFYSVGANEYGGGWLNSSDTGDGGWMVAAYTAQFGNGMSATLSLEETRRSQIINTTSPISATTAGFTGTGVGTTAAGGSGYAGNQIPDIVANLRVDQAWGSAQIMGAAHQVRPLYYGPKETSGHADDKWGFAVGAGLTLKAPMIGAGDYFTTQVNYTKGASRYSNNTASTYNALMYDGASLGFGLESDAVYGRTLGVAGTASELELTSTWGINAAFTHFWVPTLKSTLWGAYREVNYGGAANAMLCNPAGLGTTAVAVPGCDFDWSMWGIGLRTEWKATKNLSIGLEVLYSSLDSGTSATPVALQNPGAITKPTGNYTLSDQDAVQARFRITRTWYP